MKRGLLRVGLLAIAILLIGLPRSGARADQRLSLDEMQNAVCASAQANGGTEPAAVCAQGGPRLSLEGLRDAVCATADVTGQTYRPLVCDPRCDCAQGLSPSLADVIQCEESQPSVFVATGSSSHTPTCTGICEGFILCPLPGQHVVQSTCELGESCAPLPDSCGTTGVCEPTACGTSPLLCSSDDDCFGAQCLRGCFYSGLPCTTDADCSSDCSSPSGSPNGTCIDDDISCQSDADCDSGYTCDQDLALCIAPCDAGGACPSVTHLSQVLQLENVLPADDPGIVTCTAGDTNPTVSEINSNDALECLAQIEAALGQPCTPYSP